MGIVYVDSSALVKLVLPEAESEALLLALAEWPDQVSAEIAAVEVLRAARRAAGGKPVLDRARRVIDSVNLVGSDREIVENASAIDPPELGSLDALHLATAQSIDGVEAMIVYDLALARAAEAAGLTVLSPGQADGRH